MTLFQRVGVACLLAMAAVPAWAGQRRFGMRDCQVRYLYMLYAPEGFQEVQSMAMPTDELLFGFSRQSPVGTSTIGATAFPRDVHGMPGTEMVVANAVDAFSQQDPSVRIAALPPMALPGGRMAFLRRVISPATGGWALVAFVPLSTETVRVKLESSSQAAYAESLDAFEETLQDLFARFDDPPRYRVYPCSSVNR